MGNKGLTRDEKAAQGRRKPDGIRDECADISLTQRFFSDDA